MSKYVVLRCCAPLIFAAAPLVAQPAPVARISPPVGETIQAITRQVSARQIEHDIRQLVAFGNRSTLSWESPETGGKGIAAAREWIKSEFERYSQECGGCLEVKQDTFMQPAGERIPKPAQIANVYAILRGKDPANAKRIYLVTGHYDSRNTDALNTADPAPGANDDASGTAVSLECARVLSKHQFPATIVFLAVAGEEQGLYGSRHFAEMAKSQGWEIEAVLNNDIVGGDHLPGSAPANAHVVRVFSEGIPAGATGKELQLLQATGGENDSPSRELARYVAAAARRYLQPQIQASLIYRRDRFLRGGDHISFNEQGYAAVRFTDWRENFNHQHQNLRTEKGIEYGDLPKFVDFEYTARVARLNAITLALMAMSPAPPADAKLAVKELENDTTIAWNASPGEMAARYQVLWRKTSSPDWEGSKEVASGNSIRLPLSKDNVIFGIRAIGKNGVESPVVVPKPGR